MDHLEINWKLNAILDGIGDILDILDDHVQAGNDEAKLKELSKKIKSKTAALKAAVARNKPV